MTTNSKGVKEGIPSNTREAELKVVTDAASHSALAICQAWHENFAKPGWGSLAFVKGELARAQVAVDTLYRRWHIDGKRSVLSKATCDAIEERWPTLPTGKDSNE